MKKIITILAVVALVAACKPEGSNEVSQTNKEGRDLMVVPKQFLPKGVGINIGGGMKVF